MTMPEARYYKEVFRTTKDVQQTRSAFNHIAHEAPAPDAIPRADNKQTARMMKSNFQMYPDAKDTDTFTAPAKRSTAPSQFQTSESIYGVDNPRPAQKKISTVKNAELGGSDTVKPLGCGQLQAQKLQKAT